MGGREGRPSSSAETVGFKYKMSNMQAAVGCAQMERIEKLNCVKVRSSPTIVCCSKGYIEISVNPEVVDANGAWMPSAVFLPESGITGQRLLAAFAADNIDARVFFHPLSSLPMFETATESHSVGYSCTRHQPAAFTTCKLLNKNASLPSSAVVEGRHEGPMKVLLMCADQVGDAIAEWLLENHPEDLGAVVTRQ